MNVYYYNDNEVAITATAPVGDVAMQASLALNSLNSGDVKKTIADLVHPDYENHTLTWQKWRLTYDGGSAFIEAYTEKFSQRETSEEFVSRKRITPIPAFAKAAVNDIKNSIFHRTSDISRKGGATSYAPSIDGQLGGVDLKGSTMNWFIGSQILPELLTMAKVGVYVDMEPLPGVSLADKGAIHPYMYVYSVEDIRCWTTANDSEFISVLLRERTPAIDLTTGLTVGTRVKFRHLQLIDGRVQVQFYDVKGQKIGDSVLLGEKITKIPFVIFELTDSLLKDICNHQIALLNLESSDIAYTLKGNFPFYTESFDAKSNNTYLKNAQTSDPAFPADVTDTTRTKHPTDEISVGTVHGRRYPIGAERPGFIAPPTEPLKASMDKQQALKNDIRLLVNLSLAAVQPKIASADSKSIDLQGLEAGLAYIGLELERGEKQIGEIWSMYEGTDATPTVKYPRRYSLKSEADSREEVKLLTATRDEVPSITFKREISKKIAVEIVGSCVTDETLQKIDSEIDEAKAFSGNPQTLRSDAEAGFVSLETAAVTRGYDKSEPEQAAEDHALRLARIQAAQTPKGTLVANPNSSVGIGDLVVDPNAAAADKTQQRDITTNPTTTVPVRGAGK